MNKTKIYTILSLFLAAICFMCNVQTVQGLDDIDGGVEAASINFLFRDSLQGGLGDITQISVGGFEKGQILTRDEIYAVAEGLLPMLNGSWAARSLNTLYPASQNEVELRAGSNLMLFYVEAQMTVHFRIFCDGQYIETVTKEMMRTSGIEFYQSGLEKELSIGDYTYIYVDAAGSLATTNLEDFEYMVDLEYIRVEPAETTMTYVIQPSFAEHFGYQELVLSGYKPGQIVTKLEIDNKIDEILKGTGRDFDILYVNYLFTNENEQTKVLSDGASRNVVQVFVIPNLTVVTNVYFDGVKLGEVVERYEHPVFAPYVIQAAPIHMQQIYLPADSDVFYTIENATPTAEYSQSKDLYSIDVHYESLFDIGVSLFDVVEIVTETGSQSAYVDVKTDLIRTKGLGVLTEDECLDYLTNELGYNLEGYAVETFECNFYGAEIRFSRILYTIEKYDVTVNSNMVMNGFVSSNDFTFEVEYKTTNRDDNEARVSFLQEQIEAELERNAIDKAHAEIYQIVDAERVSGLAGVTQPCQILVISEPYFSVIVDVYLDGVFVETVEIITAIESELTVTKEAVLDRLENNDKYYELLLADIESVTQSVFDKDGYTDMYLTNSRYNLEIKIKPTSKDEAEMIERYSGLKGNFIGELITSKVDEYVALDDISELIDEPYFERNGEKIYDLSLIQKNETIILEFAAFYVVSIDVFLDENEVESLTFEVSAGDVFVVTREILLEKLATNEKYDEIEKSVLAFILDEDEFYTYGSAAALFYTDSGEGGKGADDDEPVIDEPVVDEPVIDEPVIDEPVIDEPIIDEPVIDEPVVDEPVIDEPVIDEPIVDEPVVEVDTVVDTSDKTAMIVYATSALLTLVTAMILYILYRKEKGDE